MSNLPDDSGRKSKSNTEATSSPEGNRPAEPAAKGETLRERVTREISENPKWSEAPSSGRGFVIGGVKRSSGKAASGPAERPYAVFVDDNFHYMNEDERYKDGNYATLEEAISKCQRIVDDFLEGEYKPGMPSAELYDRYCSFGEDPFIRGPGCDFSAWDYARQRCDELCRA